MRILLISEGTKNLAQMAASYLRSLNHDHEVVTTVTGSKKFVNKYAKQVMEEVEMPIQDLEVVNIEEYTDEAFTYTITLCQESYENQPMFTGKVHNRVHIRINDFDYSQSDDEQYVLSEFRRVREDIREKITDFYNKHLNQKKMPEFTFKMPQVNEGRKDIKEILKRN